MSESFEGLKQKVLNLEKTLAPKTEEEINSPTYKQSLLDHLNSALFNIKQSGLAKELLGFELAFDTNEEQDFDSWYIYTDVIENLEAKTAETPQQALLAFIKEADRHTTFLQQECNDRILAEENDK